MSVKLIKQVNAIVGSTRTVKLIAVVDGDILIGNPSAMYIAYNGASAFGATDDVQAAIVYSNAYLTNGSTIKKLDCTTGSVSTFAAATGTAPSGCRLAANWRGRLVLARQDATPHLWYMSRLGDPTDFDYAETDSAAAVAGNNTRAGTIGDTITALIPASDDTLFFGGDHSLWMMRGDPNDGGIILPISEQVGVIGPNAWAQAPNGDIYFVSAQGLYRLTSNGGLKELTDSKISDYFGDTDQTVHTFSLTWDRDRSGLWIFRSGASVSTSVHLFYDQRTDSYWPQKSENADILPECAMVYDGDGPDDRTLVVGGASDKLYYFDPEAVSDAGTGIDAYLWIGPALPAGFHDEARLVKLDATMGEYPDHPSLTVGAILKIQCGDSPYTALNSPTESVTISLSSGRQATQCLSMRGRVFLMKVYDFSNTQTWVLDRFSLQAQPAGMVRS